VRFVTAPVVEQVKELPTIDLVEGNENTQVGILLRLKQWFLRKVSKPVIKHGTFPNRSFAQAKSGIFQP